MLHERIMYLASLMLSVTHSIRNPGHIDVAQQIQISNTFTRGVYNPTWNAAVIMLGVDDSTQDIRIENDDPSGFFKGGLLTLDLARGYWTHIVYSEGIAALLCILAREFWNQKRTIVLGERLGEC